MSSECEVEETLAEGRALRRVAEGVCSALAEGAHEHLYDRRAAVYDAVVGTRLYNRLMWGTLPADYEEFARRAFVHGRGVHGGPLLDAGCGSFLFTARAHCESARAGVAFDQSLRMLARGRERLRRTCGRVPSRLRLLQADLGDMPFRAASFPTVLCLNVLHQYADAAGLLADLRRLLAPGGRLFLTSLVLTGRRVGDRYLKLLHGSGEFVRPRRADELEALLTEAFGRAAVFVLRGSMAFAEADQPD